METGIKEEEWYDKSSKQKRVICGAVFLMILLTVLHTVRDILEPVDLRAVDNMYALEKTVWT